MKLIIVLLIAVLVLVPGTLTTSAGIERLPPIPGAAVLNTVITGTGGPIFTPFGTPNAIRSQLTGFSGVLGNLSTRLDYSKAVSYFDRQGNLMELVIPLRDSQTAILDPDMITPDQNRMPGKVVGALWQRGRGTMVAVAIFQQGSFGATQPPYAFRFYTNNTTYIDTGMLYSRFRDFGNDGRTEAVDALPLIAAYQSCVTVGLEQVCWRPYSFEQVRDNMARVLVQEAMNRATSRYAINPNFQLEQTVPDVLGGSRRTACANHLRTATSFNNLSNCQANMIMTHSTNTQAGQPLGIWVITSTAQIRAYTTSGVAVSGGVPSGEYLVMDATPNRNNPGQVGVLMLVNINSNTHYLIPGVALQGFADNDSIDELQAAVRDGTIRRRSFGS
jgi:hypothetical protein